MGALAIANSYKGQLVLLIVVQKNIINISEDLKEFEQYTISSYFIEKIVFVITRNFTSHSANEWEIVLLCK